MFDRSGPCGTYRVEHGRGSGSGRNGRVASVYHAGRRKGDSKVQMRWWLPVLAAAVIQAGCAREPDRNQDAPAPADNVPAMPADEPMPPAYEMPAPDTLGVPDAEPGDVPTREPESREPTAPPPVPGGGPGAGGRPGGDAPVQPVSAETPAQQDEGAALLKRAAEAYASVRSLRATFVMRLDNPLLRQQTTSRGTLHQQRPDRIALRFTEPEGDVILSDGEYFWIYYPSMDPQQVIRQPARTGTESSIDLQAQFVGDPVERFRYTMHGQEAVAGRNAHVLTLVPRERTDYRSLKVWLDARDSLARRFEITDHNGAVRRFDLTDLEINPTIPASTFRFTPPPGARVVTAG